MTATQPTQPYTDYLRQRGCVDKARHPSRRVARTERRRLCREYRLKLSTVSIYRCRFCSCWHLGTRNYGLVTTGYAQPEVWL